MPAYCRPFFLTSLSYLGSLYCHSGFWQKTVFLAHFQHVAWVTKRKKEEIRLYFKTKLRLLGWICSPVTLRTRLCGLLEQTQDLSLCYDAVVTNARAKNGNLSPTGFLLPHPPHFLSLGSPSGILHTLLIRSEPTVLGESRLRVQSVERLQSPKAV